MLDAHISGPKVGRALEERGHDVMPTEKTERVPDGALPEMTVREGRVLVTHNARDLLPFVRDRPPEKGHAGLVLIPHSVKLHDFGKIIRGVQDTLGELSQGDWSNRVQWLKR